VQSVAQIDELKPANDTASSQAAQTEGEEATSGQKESEIDDISFEIDPATDKTT
jgi:hypothetical protein